MIVGLCAAGPRSDLTVPPFRVGCMAITVGLAAPTKTLTGRRCAMAFNLQGQTHHSPVIWRPLGFFRRRSAIKSATHPHFQRCHPAKIKIIPSKKFNIKGPLACRLVLWTVTLFIYTRTTTAINGQRIWGRQMLRKTLRARTRRL